MDKKLRVVYFYPKDRKPIKDHRKRWNDILTDIQEFFRTEMTRLGYKQVTISLERENGILKLHEVQGIQNDSNYTYKSGGKIRGEVFKALQAKGIIQKKKPFSLFAVSLKPMVKRLLFILRITAWGQIIIRESASPPTWNGSPLKD